MKIQDIIVESRDADAKQVLDYIHGTHHEPLTKQLQQAVLSYPRWELQSVPLSSLHIPDQEYDDEEQEPEEDPYNRVQAIDPDHAGEYSANFVDRRPIVVDADGWIIDGNHRAWAAAELLNRSTIQAWVPASQLNELGNAPAEYKPNRRRKRSLFHATVDNHWVDVFFDRSEFNDTLHITFAVNGNYDAPEKATGASKSTVRILSTVLNIVKKQLPEYMAKARPPAVSFTSKQDNRTTLYRRYFVPVIQDILGSKWQHEEYPSMGMTVFHWRPEKKQNVQEESVNPANTLYFFDVAKGGRSFDHLDLRIMGLKQSQKGRWYYQPGRDSTDLLTTATLKYLEKTLNVPARAWTKPVAENTEQKPVVIYTNNKGATIDDDIKKSLRTTQEPFNKLQMWEKHKSMQDPKIAAWVTNKLLPELKQNGVLKPLLVWNNDGQLFVIDGNHRFLAYQEAGFRGRVPVQIVPDNMITISDTVPGQQSVAESFSNAVTFFRGEPILSQERLNQLKSSIGKPYPIQRKEGSAANIGTYMSPDGDKATSFVKQALAGQGKGGVVTQIQVNPDSFSKGDGGIDEAVIITNIAGLVSNQTPNKNDPLRIQDRKQAMLKYLGPGVRKYLNDPLLSDPKMVQRWYNPEFAEKNWNTIKSGKQAVTKPGESEIQERMISVLGPLAEKIRRDPEVISYFIAHNPGNWIEYNFRMNSDGSGTKVVDVKYYPPTKQGVTESRIIDPEQVDVYYRPVSGSRGRRVVARNIPTSTLEPLLQKLSEKYAVPVESFEWTPSEPMTEAFDQPYTIQWTKQNGDWHATADLDDGSELIVLFMSQGNNQWMVEFERDENMEITGEGDAPRVFATVLTAMQQFIAKRKPARLNFSAEKEDDPTGSRARLYDRMIQRYIGGTGYDLTREDMPGGATYTLTKQVQGVVEGKLTESAIFLNPNTVIVGQQHGQPLELSPETLKKVQAIAAQHGAWYEGNGADRAYTRGVIDRYVGSFDDEVAKTASPNDPKWIYVLFANVDANNRIQRVGVDPKDTIFNRLMVTAQDNSFQGMGFTASALEKFLSLASEGKYDFVKMSQQPATEENLTQFLKAGEALMWPSNWEQYPNRAGKIARAATVDTRDQYLATRKAGVYVVGAGHLKAVQNISGKQGVTEGVYRGDWVRHPDNPWQIGQIQSIDNGQAAVTWKKTDKRKKAMSSTHAVDALQHARREFSQLTQPTHSKPAVAEGANWDDDEEDALVEALESWMMMEYDSQTIQTILSSPEAESYKQPPNVKWLYRAIVPRDREINSIKAQGPVVAFATEMAGAITFIQSLETTHDWVIIRKPFDPADFLLDFTGMYEDIVEPDHMSRYEVEHEVWMKAVPAYTKANKQEIVYTSKQHYGDDDWRKNNSEPKVAGPAALDLATIKKNPEQAYLYALGTINGRWPEAEPVIMKKPAVALKYAKNIIHGRWPEAESEIMKDPQAARKYSQLFNLDTPAPGVAENFADGKGPGRPGDSQRHGIPKKATMAELEKASHAKGRKGQLARWQLNMRRGRKK